MTQAANAGGSQPVGGLGLGRSHRSWPLRKVWRRPEFWARRPASCSRSPRIIGVVSSMPAFGHSQATIRSPRGGRGQSQYSWRQTVRLPPPPLLQSGAFRGRTRPLPKALSGTRGWPSAASRASGERLLGALDELVTHEPNEAQRTRLARGSRDQVIPLIPETKRLKDRLSPSLHLHDCCVRTVWAKCSLGRCAWVGRG